MTEVEKHLTQTPSPQSIHSNHNFNYQLCQWRHYARYLLIMLIIFITYYFCIVEMALTEYELFEAQQLFDYYRVRVQHAKC